jgi:hypothetical protein
MDLSLDPAGRRLRERFRDVARKPRKEISVAKVQVADTLHATSWRNGATSGAGGEPFASASHRHS